MLIWTENAISHITEYTIKDSDVIILAVLHTRMDVEKALKKLKRDIDL